MAQYMNERPIFHTPEGILTPYSLEQSMLKRSPAKPKMFTFAEFIVPTEKQIYKQILKMATFSKKILFEVATATAFHLLNKKNLNNKFKIGELVYIPDRLLKKHPNSLRDALGKVIEVASTTRDYVVETLDGETMKRHFSDLVNANVTKNQGEIMLIDPFQLIDYKTRIVPDHLYPKFRLHLDKFKNTTDEVHLDAPTQQDDTLNTDETDEFQTGNERIAKALETGDPNRTDKVIRNMLQNNKQEDIELPADLRNVKKPRSYNKRKEDNTGRAKSRYNEPVHFQEPEEGLAHVQEPDRQSEQPQELEVNEDEQYEAPQVVQQQNIVNESVQPHPDPGPDPEPDPDPQFEEVQTATRRSKRIPKLSAKALNLIEYDQWYNNENE